MQPGMAAKPLRVFALADLNDGIVLLFLSFRDFFPIYSHLSAPQITIIWFVGVCVCVCVFVCFFSNIGTPTAKTTANNTVESCRNYFLVPETHQPGSAR